MAGSVDAQKEQVKLEGETLRAWEKRLDEARGRLQDGDRLLNQREEEMNQREEVLKQRTIELEETRAFLEKERTLIQQSDNELNARALTLVEKEKVIPFTWSCYFC